VTRDMVRDPGRQGPARGAAIAIAAARSWIAKRPWIIHALAVAGAFVAAGQVITWSTMGAWPFHDTASSWIAAIHLRDGAPVYGGTVGGFLAELYAPPWAVLYLPASLLPLDLVCVIQLGAQIVALRYVVGSWHNTGLVAWLPFVPRELVTGNVDLLMAAAIYSGARRVRWSGGALALFALAKFSPALVLLSGDRRQARDFAAALIILCAATVPWLGLWPAWIATMEASLTVPTQAVPLLPRVPLVLLLLLIRRPWASAIAAGLGTPAFWFHSPVLLLPGLRVWWQARSDRASGTGDGDRVGAAHDERRDGAGCGSAVDQARAW